MDGFGSKRFDANTVAGRWDCKYYGSTDTGLLKLLTIYANISLKQILIMVDTKSPSSPSSPSVSGAGGFVTPSRGGSRSPSLSGGSSPPSLSGRGNYPPSYPSPGGKSPTSSSGRTNPWFPSPSTSVSEPKKKVDHYLFWDSKKNQWAVSEQVTSDLSDGEVFVYRSQIISLVPLDKPLTSTVEMIHNYSRVFVVRWHRLDSNNERFF